MKIHDHEQGSPEWFRARLGIPTASQFDRLLTPKTRKPARGQDRYLCELLTEWIFQSPGDSWSNAIVQRGTDLEDEAARWYAFETDQTVEKVGFVTTDDGRAGGSPDRLVGEDGILEIKNPLAVNHLMYSEGFESLDYIGQRQGYLWLTDRKWVDVLSYHPTLPPYLVRHERDDEWVSAFLEVLDRFCKRLDCLKQKYAEYQETEPIWDTSWREGDDDS